MDSRELENTDRPTTQRGWQFSLLWLFALTTIVSICLALGVNFPEVLIGLLIVGVGQVAVLYSADWLMRSRGGRMLSQLSALLWAIFGAALLTAGWLVSPGGNAGTISSALSISLIVGGALCWLIAWQRWP
jgi:hypothetical protein